MSATGWSSLLRQHPSLSPSDPWLFYRAGWDWRWYSWGAVTQSVTRALQEHEVPPGSQRIAFRSSPDPLSLVLDLAILAGGWTSVPVPAGLGDEALQSLLVRRRSRCLVERDGEEADDGSSTKGDPLRPLRSVSLRKVPHPGGDEDETEPPENDRLASSATGALVTTGDSHRVLAWEELAARADLLDRQIRRATRRHVWVSYGCLDDVAERGLVTWATQTGAAIVFEPRRDWLMQTVFWARPTILHGSLEILNDLEQSLHRVTGRRTSTRRLRRALGRLHSFVLTEDQPLLEESAALWRSLDVSILNPD